MPKKSIRIISGPKICEDKIILNVQGFYDTLSDKKKSYDFYAVSKSKKCKKKQIKEKQKMEKLIKYHAVYQ